MQFDGLTQFHGAKCKHDALLRLYWEATDDWGTEWANLNFFMAEVLRNEYDPARIVRLHFRAEPDTESEYRVEVDVLVRTPFRPEVVRQRLRSHPKLKKRKPVQRSKAPIVFSAEDVRRAEFEELDEKDKETLDLFHRLPLQRRIHFWQKHLAPFFS
jgi:hypothetical protein